MGAVRLEEVLFLAQGETLPGRLVLEEAVALIHGSLMKGKPTQVQETGSASLDPPGACLSMAGEQPQTWPGPSVQVPRSQWLQGRGLVGLDSGSLPRIVAARPRTCK